MSELKCPNIKIYKCSDGFVTDNAQVAKSHEANIKSNKLICPFCNKKLEPIGTSGQFQCGTWGCDASFNFYATRDVWKYIDRTRKALEIIKKEMSNEYMPDFAVISDALKTALEQKD